MEDMDNYRSVFFRKINDQKYTDADLPMYPVKTLVTHVAMKGVQLGSIFGLVFVTPAVAFYRKVNPLTAWSRVMPIYPFVGMAITMSMLYGKHQQGILDEDGVDDRAYRIHHNAGQTAADKYSTLGAAAGAAAGAVIGKLGFRSILSAGATGAALGVGFYAVELSGVLNGGPKSKD